MDAVIDEARPGDVPGVVAVHRAVSLATYPSAAHGVTVDDVRRRLDHGELSARRTVELRAAVASDRDALYVVRSTHDRVVGFAHAESHLGDVRWVVALWVLPTYQGRGLGGRLLRRCLAWHGVDEPVYVRVVAYNEHALTFYRRFGFVPTDRDVPVVDGNARRLGLRELPRVELVRPAGAS